MFSVHTVSHPTNTTMSSKNEITELKKRLDFIIRECKIVSKEVEDSGESLSPAEVSEILEVINGIAIGKY